MQGLQNFVQEEPIFTLVTTRLSTDKLYDILEKIQELISNLQEKDLKTEDATKEMIVKKNFLSGEQIVYLNYCVHSSSQPQHRLNSGYSSQRFSKTSYFEKQRNSDTNSPPPVKKLKFLPSTESSTLEVSMTDQEKRHNMETCRTDLHNSDLKTSKKSQYKSNKSGYANGSQQKFHDKKCFSIDEQKVLKLPTPTSTINRQLQDDEELFVNNKKIENQKVVISLDDELNTVEIIDLSEDEGNELGEKAFEILTEQKDKTNRISMCKPQDFPHFRSTFSEVLFPREYIEKRAYKKIHEALGNEYSKYKSKINSYYQRRSKEKPIDFSNFLNKSAKETTEIKNQVSEISTNNTDDAPLQIFNTKDDKILDQYLRKPYQYFKPIENGGEKSPLDIPIFID